MTRFISQGRSNISKNPFIWGEFCVELKSFLHKWVGELWNVNESSSSYESPHGVVGSKISLEGLTFGGIMVVSCFIGSLPNSSIFQNMKYSLVYSDTSLKSRTLNRAIVLWSSMIIVCQCWSNHVGGDLFQIGIFFTSFQKSTNLGTYLNKNKWHKKKNLWFIQFRCLIQNILCWSLIFTNCHHYSIVHNKFGNVMFNHTSHFVSRDLASWLVPQVGWFWL